MKPPLKHAAFLDIPLFLLRLYDQYFLVEICQCNVFVCSYVFDGKPPDMKKGELAKR
jgi:hypothetical protein